MSERFFAERPIDSDHVTLDGSEAHHLIHVMRSAVGMDLTLFDGSGVEFTSRIVKISRSTVDFEVLSRQELDRELASEGVLTTKDDVAGAGGDTSAGTIDTSLEVHPAGE